MIIRIYSLFRVDKFVNNVSERSGASDNANRVRQLAGANRERQLAGANRVRQLAGANRERQLAGANRERQFCTP